MHFISLAPISDPGLVVAVIAQSLGLRETGNRPLLDILKRFLHDRHLLLVLDNFEQLLQAAPLVAELLSSGRRLKILVTSRALLRVYGEYDVPVPPLALPGQPVPPPTSSAGTRRFGCSSIGRARSRSTSQSRRSMRQPSRKSARVWMAFRWRSSWRRPGYACCQPRRCSLASNAGSSVARRRGEGPAGPSADPSWHDRLEPRSPLGRRTGPLSATGRLRRRLHARGGGSGHRSRMAAHGRRRRRGIIAGFGHPRVGVSGRAGRDWSCCSTRVCCGRRSSSTASHAM